MITFDDFQKIDLRVGRIISAEKVEGSDKLLKLRVDLGPEIGQRQLVAGMAQFYQPEEMVGKQIVVVVNLEPKVFKGLESQGMLLAVGDNEPVLLLPNKEVPLGAKVR